MTEPAIDMRGMGDNLPPLPTPAELREDLASRFASLAARRDELLTSAAEWPERIETEDESKDLTDLLSLFRALITEADSHRKKEKEPWLRLGQACDGWFSADLIDKLETVRKRLHAVNIKYLDRKEAYERSLREQAALIARQEADRKLRDAEMAEAARSEAARYLEEAVRAEQRAVQAAEAAKAKPAELSRVRGHMGSVASLRRRWRGEVTKALLTEEGMRKLISKLSVDDLNGAATAIAKEECGDGRPVPDYPGIRLYQETF